MTDLFEDLMREVDPARGMAPLGPDRRTAILSDATDPAVTDLAPRRTRRWGRLAAVAASVAVLTAGALLIQATTAPAPHASAQDVLRRAARAASDPATRPDQYWKITGTGTTLSGISEGGVDSLAVLRGEFTSYVAVDGRRPSWSVRGAFTIDSWPVGPPKPELVALQPARVYTTDLAPAAVPGSWQQPNPAWLATLPRDPGALKARLYADAAGAGHSADEEAYVYLGDVFRSGIVPADLAAALYQVMQTIPGTVVSDQHATLGGRTGVGITHVGSVDKLELVIDPATGQPIGVRQTTTNLPRSGGPTPAATPAAQSGQKVTTEVAITRTLVDDVPADVKASAIHGECSLGSDGTVACQR